MSIFNNKKEYIIVTNMALNEAVRGFAEKHCADGCEIEIHAHGCLLDEDNLVEVKFTSTDKKDIIHSGIYITGGGSMIHNLDKLFQEITGIKVNTCDEPESCAVRGLVKIVSDSKYPRSYISSFLSFRL